MLIEPKEIDELFLKKSLQNVCCLLSVLTNKSEPLSQPLYFAVFLVCLQFFVRTYIHTHTHKATGLSPHNETRGMKTKRAGFFFVGGSFLRGEGREERAVLALLENEP